MCIIIKRFHNMAMIVQCVPEFLIHIFLGYCRRHARVQIPLLLPVPLLQKQVPLSRHAMHLSPFHRHYLQASRLQFIVFQSKRTNLQLLTLFLMLVSCHARHHGCLLCRPLFSCSHRAFGLRMFSDVI